ncbi:fatty-acid oxidation protein subunit alpha [bacterium]|nr:fatty-acid oxidation protein subunit alpha [bacterium]
MSWRLDATNGHYSLTYTCDALSMPILTTTALQALDTALIELSSNPDCLSLQICSEKPHVFIAGADIQEIASIHDAQDGEKKATMGQRIFNRLEDLPFPTVAVIDGACLGGGLELALACTYRIASDHAKTQLGLPETTLGIIPGFGGTYRLPKTIGLPASLDMILSGRSVSANRALKLGLVDQLEKPAFLHATSAQFVQNIPKITRRKHTAGFPGKSRFMTQIAKKSVLKKTNGHYPAPLMALKTIQKTAFKPRAYALKCEAHAFGVLVHTNACKTLIDLYFSNETLKRCGGDTRLEHTASKLPKCVGVLGAGFMGGGIAFACAKSGISTRFQDLNWEAILSGYKTVDTYCQQAINRKKMTRHEHQTMLHRLSGNISPTSLSKQSFVIEAIVEDLAIKQTVFQAIEPHIDPAAILASNTSGLSIDHMANGLKHPERFIGMHFFSPVNRMPLVEVIPGSATNIETLQATFSLAKQLKKIPIVVKNSPGFLINRILIPYINEAAHMVCEGYSIAAIDRIATQFGMPVGPLTLVDEVGIDIGMKVANQLGDHFGERLRISSLFEVFEQNPSWLGKKTGYGFYDYTSKKTVNKKLTNTVVPKAYASTAIEDRLMLTLLNEAARCLEEAVVSDPKLLDMGLIMGIGFPPFRGGILRYADAIGIDTVVNKLKALADTIHPRFSPSDLLVTMAANNQRFY